MITLWRPASQSSALGWGRGRHEAVHRPGTSDAKECGRGKTTGRHVLERELDGEREGELDGKLCGEIGWEID